MLICYPNKYRNVMRLKFGLVVLLLVLFPLAGKAQDPTNRENIICTTHRTIWQGTAADIQNIQVQPIPESFRREVEFGMCRHTDSISLVNWHHKYGSEEIMKTADKSA